MSKEEINIKITDNFLFGDSLPILNGTKNINNLDNSHYQNFNNNKLENSKRSFTY